MRGLVRDVLDAGRIDSGTLSVAPEPSEVAVLVERARRTFLSGGGRHVVLVDLPAGLPPVMADRRRIVQVLNNLLSNAARHAPESTPIRVAAVREDAHVAVSVSDEGSGVAPERLPRLFSKHAGAGQGETAGHGLGLAISKGLVEAHGGRIRAESPGTGRGATFTFTLPVAGEAGGAAAHARTPPPAPEPGAPSRVLVVDDDPRALRFLRDALSEAGYAPLVTGASRELPCIIRTERPRLVLLLRSAAASLEVGGRLQTHPQHATADRGLLEKAPPTGDGGDRRPKESVPVDLLPRVEPGDTAPVSNGPCDGRRPAAGGRPHAWVAQPDDSFGQYPEVVVTTESITRTGRIRAVATVVLPHRPVRSRRPEPERGQVMMVLMHSSISSSSQPGAPMRAAPGDLPSSMWATIVERHIRVRSFATGNRKIRVAIGVSSGIEETVHPEA